MSRRVVAERDVASAEPRLTGSEARRRIRIGKNAERVVGVASPLFLIAVWELLVRSGALDARFFPAPSMITGTFWELLRSGELFLHVQASMGRVLIGFALGAVPGVVLGISMGLFRLLRAAVWPLINVLYPIPKIALLPMVLLMFGLGETSKWVIIAIGAFFPVLINSMAGVVAIEQIYHDVGKNFGAGPMNRYLTIALPGALPLVLTGMRLGWGIALLVIVAAEFVGAQSGLGFLIWNSWLTFSVESMYVGLVVIAGIGYVSFLGLDKLTKVVVPWRPSRPGSS